MSMVIGGVRWTLYPESSRKRDPEGPRMVKLPLPGWDERLANSPEIVTNLEQLAERIEEAKDPANQVTLGRVGNRGSVSAFPRRLPGSRTPAPRAVFSQKGGRTTPPLS